MTTLTEKTFILEESDIENPEWKLFSAKHSRCFFCHPEWSRVLDSGYHIRTLVYLLKQDGKIKLALPAARFDFGWFRLIHAYTPYGEFVGEQEWIPVFLKKLEELAAQKGIHQIRITQLAPRVYEPGPDYRFHEGCQHLLDLKGKTPDSLWEGYKKNIRRDIRIAQRAEIVVRELETRGDIDAYYELYRKTMQRKHALGPHPRRLYHEIEEKLAQKGEAVFLAAQQGERLVAGVILIFFEDTVYLLGNASDPDFLSLCPNDLLMHESLMWSLKHSFRYFDFMTTGESFDGHGPLSNFKEKWGAQRFPFRVYEKNLSLWRAALWNTLWRYVNTPAGSAVLRRVLNR